MLGKSVEKFSRKWRITKPPKVRQKRKAVNVNVLSGNHLEQPHSAMRSAKAAVLHATPRRLRNGGCIKHLVDGDGSRLDSLGQSSSARDVFSPNTGGQSIHTVVCEPYCFRFRFERHHRQHGAKRFLAHHFHVVIDIS